MDDAGAMVLATGTPIKSTAAKLKKAAQITAILGGQHPGGNHVAMELAES